MCVNEWAKKNSILALNQKGEWAADTVVVCKQIEYQRKGPGKVVEPKFPI